MAAQAPSDRLVLDEPLPVFTTLAEARAYHAEHEARRRAALAQRGQPPTTGQPAPPR